MARVPPQPGHRQRTPYADLYGHPYNTNAVKLQNPVKSGLTPLPEGPFDTAEKLLQWTILHDYQRDRLVGKYC